MILSDGEITLFPSTDTEYLLKLARTNKYTHCTEEELVKSLDYVKYAWNGYAGRTLSGIVYLCYLPRYDWWTLDAYKEDELLKFINNKGDFSYRAGKLVIDWFFKNVNSKTLYTVHERENRGATVVCKRLGFKESGFINDFIVLKNVSDGK